MPNDNRDPGDENDFNLHVPAPKALETPKLPKHPFKVGDVVIIKGLGGPPMLVTSCDFQEVPKEPVVVEVKAAALHEVLFGPKPTKMSDSRPEMIYLPLVDVCWFNKHHEMQSGTFSASAMDIFMRADEDTGR